MSSIKHIKPGEHDGSDNVSTDHIINVPPELYRHLAILFSKMLQYGYTPKQFRFSKLIPIPKNKRKSLNDSTNYRAIALSSIFGKVFNWVILEMYKNNFHTSDLQHGFKKGLSTMTCTYVLGEVVNYYNKNNTKVYALLLDASEAFDRVSYLKLFHTLVDKEMCPLLIRFLINISVCSMAEYVI